MKRFDPDSAVVLIVDVQERLAQVMPQERLANVQRSASILLEAALLWEMPVFVTEQYPKGLGPTLSAIQQRLMKQRVQRFEKTEFSVCDAAGFNESLAAVGRDTCIVIGMETHVCVFQTVRDLTASGRAVLLPVDGVISRRDDHREVGLGLCAGAGATLTTTETLVFDGLRKAGNPEFSALLASIR